MPVNLHDRVVRTVLGDVRADSLGHVQPHEHVLADVRVYLVDYEDMPLSERHIIDAPITLQNVGYIRRFPHRNRENLERFDVGEAIEALNEYREWGGGALVDSTSIGLGRDPVGLARVARATGLHIIMGGGIYIERAHPAWVRDSDIDEIADVLARDVEEGVNGTPIKTGIIGEVGLSLDPTSEEERSLRAAVRAQLRTGAALQIHAVSPHAGLRAVEVVREEGGRLDRTILSHVDSQADTPEAAIALAESGVYIEYDFFGLEQTFYRPGGVVEGLSDRQRIDLLLALAEAGYIERLLISSDFGPKTQMTRYGGDGLHHILRNVLPQARAQGMTPEQLRQICEVNPSTVLSLEPVARS